MDRGLRRHDFKDGTVYASGTSASDAAKHRHLDTRHQDRRYV